MYSVFSGLFDNLHIWAATVRHRAAGIAIAFAPLAGLLALTRLTATDLFVIATCAVLPIVVVEIYKVFLRAQLRHEQA